MSPESDLLDRELRGALRLAAADRAPRQEMGEPRSSQVWRFPPRLRRSTQSSSPFISPAATGGFSSLPDVARFSAIRGCCSPDGFTTWRSTCSSEAGKCATRASAASLTVRRAVPDSDVPVWSGRVAAVPRHPIGSAQFCTGLRTVIACQDREVPPLRDRIAPGVRVLFVGINPGIRSAETGHHFAGYSNRFWKLLFDSKLVPEPIDWRADDRLPEWGFGITNLVARETPGIDTLAPRGVRCGRRRAARQGSPFQARDRGVCRSVAVSLDFRCKGGGAARAPARDIRRRAGVRPAEPQRPEREFLLRRNAGLISKAPT